MCSLWCGQKGEGGPVGGCHPSLARFCLPGRLWTRGREIAVLNRDRQRAGRDLGGCSPLICHHQAQRRQATWGHGQQVCVGTRPAGFALPFPSKFADGASKTPSGLSNSGVFILVSETLEGLVPPSTRMLSKGKDQGRTTSPSLFSALGSFSSFFTKGAWPCASSRPHSGDGEFANRFCSGSSHCRGAGAAVSLHFL